MIKTRRGFNRRDFLFKAAPLAPFSLVPPFSLADLFLRLALEQSPRRQAKHPAANQPGGPIRFELARASCGLDFVLRNGAQGRKYQVETLPGGLGVIDFDGDGWPDLFCVNGAALPSLIKTGKEYWNRLYRNNRDGTFSDVTEKAGLAGQGYGMGVAVGDYNNDGHEDLFVVGVHGNQLYRNNGDGTFTDVTEKAGLGAPGLKKLWSVAAAWIDYDSDGRLDLFISNYCDWDAASDPVCGGYCHPDVYRAEPMQLFHNNGDGTFTQMTAKEGFPEVLGKGMGIAMADFAGDGRPGLFVANDNARNLLFRPAGNGFQEIGTDAEVAYNGDGRNISGMGADFGDIDGDGQPDLVMTGLRNETYDVFLNRFRNGAGAFEDGSASTGLLALSRPWSGWGCGLVDLDNDGWLDLFVANGGFEARDAQANRVFRNVKGKFADVSDAAGKEFALARMHRGAVFADFDRDGRLDAAVTAMGERIELWWNRSPRKHWLQVRLKGTKSNRSAIGAQVTCKSASRTQSRCVTNCVGYASSSDLTVHFGLGEDRKAAVEIRWPSGVVQKLGEVAADQRMEVEETI
ncbi:MAG TPA: CRTAC1 family protein [Candidatus Acidoferrum sp.]|nr:CRTAC1 family protein [Candidatus Acidoferrum sp.]